MAIVLYATEGNHAIKGVVLFGNEKQRNIKLWKNVRVKDISACMEDESFQDRTKPAVSQYW